MSEQTIQCPVCSQEFPLYDQRGFRNAGFTAHRKWCTERQQQLQNDGHQQDQQSTRASRFAMAIRRRLLPANQAPDSENEGPSRISPMPILPGSSTTSVHSDPSSSSATEPPIPPFDSNSAPPLHPHPPLHQQNNLQHQQRHQPVLRQRHTWNHWNTRRDMPRRTSMNAMVIPCEIIHSTSAPTPPTSWNLQMDCSSRAIDPESHASPTYSSTTTDAPTASWPISQTTLPHLSGPPASSPIDVSNSPFSFASMITTLPLEYSLEYSGNETNSNVNVSYIDSSSVHPPPIFTQVDQYTSSGLPPDYLSPDRNTSIQQQYYDHQSGSSYQRQNNAYHYHDMSPFTVNDLPLSQASEPLFQQHQVNTTSGSMAATSTTFMDTSATSSSNTFVPSHLNNYQPNVLYCGYCEPRDGLHDSSCGLLQFLLTNIMDSNENTYSLP